MQKINNPLSWSGSEWKDTSDGNFVGKAEARYLPLINQSIWIAFWELFCYVWEEELDAGADYLLIKAQTSSRSESRQEQELHNVRQSETHAWHFVQEHKHLVMLICCTPGVLMICASLMKNATKCKNWWQWLTSILDVALNLNPKMPDIQEGDPAPKPSP